MSDSHIYIYIYVYIKVKIDELYLEQLLIG